MTQESTTTPSYVYLILFRRGQGCCYAV